MKFNELYNGIPQFQYKYIRYQNIHNKQFFVILLKKLKTGFYNGLNTISFVKIPATESFEKSSFNKQIAVIVQHLSKLNPNNSYLIHN